MIVSIIIPILNEEQLVENSLAQLEGALDCSFSEIDYQVIVADGGSQDLSFSLVEVFCAERDNWTCSTVNLKNPSVARTVSIGVPMVKGDYALILPIDCYLSVDSLRALKEALLKGSYDYGGFGKKYKPNSFFLSLYAWIQNQIRTKLLKNLVWTNAIFVRRELLVQLELDKKEGFLEDVILSDYLKKYDFSYIDQAVEVSSRRYQVDNIFVRMGINILIISLYRLGYRRIEDLKKLYKLFS